MLYTIIAYSLGPGFILRREHKLGTHTLALHLSIGILQSLGIFRVQLCTLLPNGSIVLDLEHKIGVRPLALLLDTGGVLQPLGILRV